ncbi:MAG: peptidoglycan hydrolase [Rhodothermales bacterium]|nr:peptidoglycan hydrolase [Rhodothermales bacterium]
MSVSLNPTDPAARPSAPGAARRPASPEEAAEQFEAVLVRQFVQAMTKELFQGSLADEGGVSSGYADQQRDVLTDALTEHLVDAGTLRLRDLLLRQWDAQSDSTP